MLSQTILQGHAYNGQALDPLGRFLVQTTLRHYFWLDSIVQTILDKPLQKKHQDLKLLLILGISATEFLKQPIYTSVNAAVETTKRLKKPWAKGLVNASLRTFQRTRQAVINEIHAEVALTNHPLWILDRIQADWPDQKAAIIAANNDPAPMILRVNAGKQTRAAYQILLAAKDLMATPCDLSPNGLILDQAVAVGDLPGFDEGWVSVQDSGAQLAAQLLQPKPFERVLDACSAPGSKSCHLLELAPTLDLVSVDIDADRLTRVSENFTRLGATGDLRCLDLAKPQPELGTFDRILLDTPCSASGVIRRHPDIKLLRRPEDLAPLIETQRQLLTQCWSLLRPGGSLLYVTCSIFSDENEDNLVWFLANHHDVETLALPAVGVPRSIGVQLLPTKGVHDGFYYAHVRKMSPGL
ncbi:16S rRNA (cytosine(967)-C(5))-methyltransferase RsmB [Pseudomonadales bacterium]|nr:16S rRNA (cytosine(967)-C(5))-methyltransferase RsmB [Pseudomonadales bacterium]